MKTISELQQEIRDIQKGLQFLDKRLKTLDDELVNFKEIAQNNSLYQRVYELAAGMPVIKHPLMQENQAVKNNYFAILIMVATLEDSINENQLLFLQRIIMDDPYNKWLNHYVRQLGKITPENVVYNCDEIIKRKLAEQLLLDLLIIANLSRAKTNRTFELITHIVAFLDINKEVVGHISEIGVTVLTQNIDYYPCPFNDSSINRDKLKTNGATAKLIKALADMLVQRTFQTLNWETRNEADKIASYNLMLEDNEKFGYYLFEITGWQDIINKALQEKSNIQELIDKKSNILLNLQEKDHINRLQYCTHDGSQLFDLGWEYEKKHELVKALYCYNLAKNFGNELAANRLSYLNKQKSKT